MSAPRPLAVDVVSDVVCPWCYLGKRRLDAAVAATSELDVEVRWRPYQLDPSIPPEGRDRRAYMAAKFPDAAQLEAAHERLRELGRQVGIDYRFEAIERSPNTLDAHRLIRWATVEGVQAEVVERLFALYFVEGADIGRHAVLAAAAGDAGMDAGVALRLLGGDADRQEVLDEIATAQRIGVTGVPCMIIDSRYAVMGAQETASIAAALRQVAAEPPAKDAE